MRLTVTAKLGELVQGMGGAVPLVIIVLREFAVTSVRLVAAANGKVIAANMWGKVKTVSQIIAIVAVFMMQTAFDVICLISEGAAYTSGELSLMNEIGVRSDILTVFNVFNSIGQVLIWISAVFTVISGVKYLLDNKEVISDM